jgi:hypothetical protein
VMTSSGTTTPATMVNHLWQDKKRFLEAY